MHFWTNPSNYTVLVDSLSLRGTASHEAQTRARLRFSAKAQVHVQHTGVESMPENYEERLTELYPGRFKNIRLFVPNAYDLVLSKLSRNIERDRQDVGILAKTTYLDPTILQQRYELELKPNLIGPPSQHDLTLEFWLEAYFATPRS